MRRSLMLDQADAESDTFELSFSSEEPVSRAYGNEILSHLPGAVDLTRLNSGAAPLLWNHDENQLLGIVERAWIEDGRGRAKVRWGTSPEAEAKRREVAAGVIRNVSVGYSVVDGDMDDAGAYVASRWEPVEISLVSVPADPSVGLGRSLNTSTSTSTRAMNHSTAMPIVGGGGSLPDEFGKAERQFSMVKAIQASASNDWSAAGLEREVSRELQLRENRNSGGFLVPAAAWQKRAYTAGSASAGGDLIGTDHLAGSFVESLRARLAVAQMGATMLPGLVGSVSIPRRTGSASAYWFGADDSDSITESTGTIGAISMTPKTVGAYSRFSRLMQLQSTPEIEQLIRRDFIALLAEAIDAAAINGLGSSSQPEGILQVTGIGLVEGGANGASPTINHLIDLKAAVAIDNADTPTCGFLTNSKVEASLAKLADTTNRYQLNPYGAEIGQLRIAGRRMEVSNNVPSNLAKGSGTGLSAILYGNFADLLIGMWGSLEILVDPYTDFAKGSVGVRALQSIDIAVRHPESFAVMVDAIA